MSRALVLAGGGIAGIAWETGFLTGVGDVEPATAAALLDSDLLLGTSAGATVAAQLGSGAGLDELFARQVAEPTDELTPQISIDELLEVFEEVTRDPAASRVQTLQRVGRHALAAHTVSEVVRRAVIATRLPSHDWPERALAVTAIDVVTGERVLFDRRSGVGLIDAVAASCAVPGVWPPVTIGDRRFMDGGIGSTANVDAAAGCDSVVLLAPTQSPGLSPFGPTLVDELSAWPDGAAVGVFADDESIRAFGRNPLDPACRAASAEAGREQGRRQAGEVAEFVAVTAGRG